MKPKNALDNIIEFFASKDETKAFGVIIAGFQSMCRKMAESQIESGKRCYYCNRSAKDLLDQNIFDPVLYDFGGERPYCFLCSEHGMYGDVEHIDDSAKKEECLERFDINRDTYKCIEIEKIQEFLELYPIGIIDPGKLMELPLSEIKSIFKQFKDDSIQKPGE